MESAKIVSKIRKLLALSKSDNTHEAELALEKANDLMLAHQIEVSEIDFPNESPTILREDVDSIRAKWASHLAAACAELHECKIIMYSNNSSVIAFVGDRAGIDCAKATFSFLLGAWHTISSADFADYKAHGGAAHWKAYKSAHGAGFARAIRARCRTLAEQRKAAVRAHSSSGTALVLRTESALADYLEGYKRSTVRLAPKSACGLSAGVAAGNAVNLGKNLSAGE